MALLTKLEFTQTQALWDTVTPPAARNMPDGTPWSSLNPIGRLGWWESFWVMTGSHTPQQRSSRSVLGLFVRTGGLANGEAVRTRNSLLPGEPWIWNGYSPRPRADLPPGGQPGRNGTPLTLIVLLPGRLLGHGLASLRLPGWATKWGPPAGGWTACRSLHSALLFAHRSVGWPRQSPGGSLPANWNFMPCKRAGMI